MFVELSLPLYHLIWAHIWLTSRLCCTMQHLQPLEMNNFSSCLKSSKSEFWVMKREYPLRNCEQNPSLLAASLWKKLKKSKYCWKKSGICVETFLNLSAHHILQILTKLFEFYRASHFKIIPSLLEQYFLNWCWPFMKLQNLDNICMEIGN